MSKRRINKKRLAILIASGTALAILVIGGLWWGIHSWLDHQEQQRRQAKAAEVYEEQSRLKNLVDTTAKPEDMEEEYFDQLKQQASACIDAPLMEKASSDKRISNEDYETLQAYSLSDSCSQAEYFLEHIEEYDGEILTYYLKNTDRYEFVKAWPQRDQYQTAPETLTESLDTVPALIQWDLRWGYEPYGDSTVYYAGCAPTSLSMVFSYLKQDPSLTPAVLKTFSEENGYYVSGAGTAHALLSEAADAYGVTVEGLSVDQESVSQALSEGKVLVFNMVPGTFTEVGHFIVVYGEKDGKLLIRDPNSIERTQKEWEYSEVLPETAAIWAYSTAQTD